MSGFTTKRYEIAEYSSNSFPAEIEVSDLLLYIMVAVIKSGNQISRCGTAGAAIYAEAQGAESRKDFIHKMKLSLKELRETYVWLKMTQKKPLIKPSSKMDPIIKECNELISIFVKSIETAKLNQHYKKKN